MLVASKSADEEHATEKRSTKLYNPIIFLLGLLTQEQKKPQKNYIRMSKQTESKKSDKGQINIFAYDATVITEKVRWKKVSTISQCNT